MRINMEGLICWLPLYPTSEPPLQPVFDRVKDLTYFNHQPCLQKRDKIEKIQWNGRERSYWQFLL
jgi:hypothetical protein